MSKWECKAKKPGVTRCSNVDPPLPITGLFRLLSVQNAGLAFFNALTGGLLSYYSYSMPGQETLRLNQRRVEQACLSDGNVSSQSSA